MLDEDDTASPLPLLTCGHAWDGQEPWEGHCQSEQSKPPLIALPYSSLATGSAFLGAQPR